MEPNPYTQFELNVKRIIEFSSVDPQVKDLLFSLMAEVLRLEKAQAGNTQPSLWLR